MQLEMEVRTKCPECSGLGEIDYPEPAGTLTCKTCEGVGYFSREIISPDLEAALADILDKCNDILEVVKP